MNTIYTKCILGYTFWTNIVLINFENSFFADINKQMIPWFSLSFSGWQISVSDFLSLDTERSHQA